MREKAKEPHRNTDTLTAIITVTLTFGVGSGDK